MKRKYQVLLLIGLVSLAACQSPESTESTPEEAVESNAIETTTSTETTTSADTTTAEETIPEESNLDNEENSSDQNEQLEAGKFYLDFPIVSTIDAPADSFVLAPSTSALREAREQGVRRARILFYSRKMLTPGSAVSTLEEFSESVQIPNALIVPIKPNQSVQPGDIVLTWWQSASGMTRAVVLEGGTETEPLVKYLDLKFESEPETLAPSTFHKLNEALEPGTAVAYPDGNNFTYGFVIKRAQGKILVANTFDVLEVVDEAQVTTIPISPQVSAGDSVFVPVIGNFTEGEVTEVNAPNAMVSVKYTWAGEETTEKFPYGSILKSL